MRSLSHIRTKDAHGHVHPLLADESTPTFSTTSTGAASCSSSGEAKRFLVPGCSTVSAGLLPLATCLRSLEYSCGCAQGPRSHTTSRCTDTSNGEAVNAC